MPRFRSDDSGVALPAVIGLGTVMLIVVATALTVGLSGLRQANADQDGVGALDAAYAGTEDYLARLDLNTGYVQYGNPADTAFGADGTRQTDASNPAFGAGAGGTWTTVAGSDPMRPAQFRYEVDNSDYSQSGIVHLRSTGRVGSAVRTMVVDIQVGGFFRYIYFTDLETRDPALAASGYTDPSLKADPSQCKQYAWAGRPAGCGVVQFTAGDSIRGALHSNDTIVSCGTTFNGAVTSASTAQPVVQPPAGCASTGTFPPGSPSKASIVAMPDSNRAMLQNAQQSGCVYTGPTTITYTADGYMTVISPWTRNTYGTPQKVAAGIDCGNLTDLHSTGARVRQLPNSLLYVQTVPRDSSDSNYWAASGSPPKYTINGTVYAVTCLGADGSTPAVAATGAGWTFTSGATTLLQHPLAGEVPASGWQDSQNASLWSTTSPAYGCSAGDLYVQGAVAAQTTAAADDYVWVTGDVTLDLSKNVFGLVGQNGVLVYNPVKGSGSDPYGYSSMLSGPATGTTRTIDAAILAVAHTFQVENYDRAQRRGTLAINGSIAQEFRGTVGATYGNGETTGYLKLYQYDTLLRTVAPPYFLQPSSTTFSIVRYASVAPAFNADGSSR